MLKDKKYADLKLREKLLSERLRRIADILGDAAIARAYGVTTEIDADEERYVRAYEETLARIEKLTDEGEQLLIEQGILPQKASCPPAEMVGPL